MTIKELSIAEDIANLIAFLHAQEAASVVFDKSAGLRFKMKEELLKETLMMPAENNSLDIQSDWAFDLKGMLEHCTIRGLELKVHFPEEASIYADWEKKAMAIGNLPMEELMVEGMKIIPTADKYEDIEFVVSIRNAQ